MPDWSIKFVPAKHPKPGVLADFVLDVPGNPPGPFDVFTADNISWNNTTPDEHWPAVFQPVQGAGPPQGPPEPIGDVLKQRESSPQYSVGAKAGAIIRFCCKKHPNEVGILKVIAPGTPPSV
jgi:hypothetical protein